MRCCENSCYPRWPARIPRSMCAPFGFVLEWRDFPLVFGNWPGKIIMTRKSSMFSRLPRSPPAGSDGAVRGLAVAGAGIGVRGLAMEKSTDLS
jgi:hypothetical protein